MTESGAVGNVKDELLCGKCMRPLQPRGQNELVRDKDDGSYD